MRIELELIVALKVIYKTYFVLHDYITYTYCTVAGKIDFVKLETYFRFFCC